MLARSSHPRKHDVLQKYGVRSRTRTCSSCLETPSPRPLDFSLSVHLVYYEFNTPMSSKHTPGDSAGNTAVNGQEQSALSSEYCYKRASPGPVLLSAEGTSRANRVPKRPSSDPHDSLALDDSLSSVLNSITKCELSITRHFMRTLRCTQHITHYQMA